MFVSLLAAALAVPAAVAAPSTPPAAQAVSTFTLDTPIEQLVASTAAKAALDRSVPGLSTHEHYDMFKSMSLRQLAPMSQGRLTDETLAKVEAELAKVK